LPERTGQAASTIIIEYAISAPNRLGQPMYKRGGLALSSSERACGRYATPSEAQEAFLKAGGPQRDPKNLDPDGDGFACTWDPTPFQAARDVGQTAGQQGLPTLPADAGTATGQGG
jgi:hypothetical protein